MMRPGVRIGVVAVIASVIVGNALLFGGALGHWAAGWTGRMAAPLVGRFASIRDIGGRWFSGRDLAVENRILTERIEIMRQQTADVDVLRQELATARDAADLHLRIARPLTAGAVFAYLRSGGVREVLVNRGTRDDVAVGDVVATPRGALVGLVQRVFFDHALVRTVDDPAFEVTGKILTSEVSGLVRFDMNRGVILDLVHKEESVVEGDVVVTSGNDRILPGLVIGTVRAVETIATTLFLGVRISPAVPEPEGTVMIFRP